MVSDQRDAEDERSHVEEHFRFDPGERQAHEIEQWFLAFFPFTRDPLSRLLFPGRFKNVTAIGFSKPCRTWVIHEFTFSGAKVIVLPDNEESLRLLAKWTIGSVLLKVENDAMLKRPRLLGLVSVPAVAHLTRGLSAWTPSGLYRKMVARGATPIDASTSFARTKRH